MRTIWVLKCPCVLLFRWYHFCKSCPWTRHQAWLYFCWALAVCRWISVFFSVNCLIMCIVHGLAYVPNSCLNITIVPICNNKNGNMSDTSNYRPVATLVSKILEHFIWSSISPCLGTTDNQFGFKAGHSTDQSAFLLKQSASYFVTYGSSVYAVF